MWLPILGLIYVGGAIVKYNKIKAKDKHPVAGAALWPLGILGGSGPFQG